MPMLSPLEKFLRMSMYSTLLHSFKQNLAKVVCIDLNISQIKIVITTMRITYNPF